MLKRLLDTMEWNDNDGTKEIRGRVKKRNELAGKKRGCLILCEVWHGK